MKRDKFILTMLAATTVPVLAYPQIQNTSTGIGKGFKVKAGDIAQIFADNEMQVVGPPLKID